MLIDIEMNTGLTRQIILINLNISDEKLVTSITGTQQIFQFFQAMPF